MERWLQQASRSMSSHSMQSVQPTALPPTLQPTPGGAMLLQSYIMVGMHAVDDVVVLANGQESLWLQAAKVGGRHHLIALPHANCFLAEHSDCRSTVVRLAVILYLQHLQ